MKFRRLQRHVYAEAMAVFSARVSGCVLFRGVIFVRFYVLVYSPDKSKKHFTQYILVT